MVENYFGIKTGGNEKIECSWTLCINVCTMKRNWNKDASLRSKRKYQSEAFVICDHKSDETRSVTQVNKAYLVWLMFRVLSNQHYQQGTNQKLLSWANAVFQNRGECAQAFPSFPSPSPVIPFFFVLVPTLSTNSRGSACYAGYKDAEISS